MDVSKMTVGPVGTGAGATEDMVLGASGRGAGADVVWAEANVQAKRAKTDKTMGRTVITSQGYRIYRVAGKARDQF